MRIHPIAGWLWAGVMAILALSAGSWAQETEYTESQRLGMESHIGKLTGHAKAGAPLYKRLCIGCHGALGNGEGDNAQWIDPKPRNLP
jgi:cytochrome c